VQAVDLQMHEVDDRVARFVRIECGLGALGFGRLHDEVDVFLRPQTRLGIEPRVIPPLDENRFDGRRTKRAQHGEKP
jgi:hypothetical protein